MTKATIIDLTESTTNVEAMNGINDNFDALNSQLPADVDGAIVSRLGTQTITNKTLTSPTINMPTTNDGTFNNPTLVSPQLGTPDSGNLENCTFPTLNQNTTGSANSLKSASGIVDVSASTAPTAGQALIATSGTVASWQNISTAPKMTFDTIFETAARFTSSVSGGTLTYDTNGVNITTTSTTTRFSSVRAEFFDAFLFLGNPIFTCQVKANTVTGSGSGDAFFGINFMTIAGGAGGITFTERHIGFKFTKVSSTTVNLAGTQADGTTEATTGTLTTAANGDVFDLIFVANSSTSVTYYYRKNGGTLSAGNTVSTNFPTRSSSTQDSIALMSSNKGTAAAFDFIAYSMSYSR